MFNWFYVNCASQEIMHLGGQAEALTAAAKSLQEHHGDASIPVAAAEILLSGTVGSSAGQEEEDAALSLARDENLMQALAKVS